MKFQGILTSVGCVCVFALLFTPLVMQSAIARETEVALAQSQSPEVRPGITLNHRAAGEDWNSVALEPNTLFAEKPLVGEKDESIDFTRELLQVQWRPDDLLDLYVVRPHGVEKPPVILYLYSYPSDPDRFRDDAYCRRVTKGGFAAVGFASALTGHRYHSRPMKQWFVSELQESMVTSVHDVQMIFNYLSTRGDVDMDRVGMFGEGSGGAIAIMAAAVDPRIKAVDVLNPWGDWPKWLAASPRVPDAERPNYLTPQFLAQVAPFDPVQWLPRLTGRPVRIQDVAAEPITPEICKAQIEAAAPAHSTEIVKYETTRALLDASTGGKLFQWLKDRLSPASGGGSSGTTRGI
jgi:Acetyl xylan esterase (AXE1)